MAVKTENPNSREVVYVAETPADLQDAIDQARKRAANLTPGQNHLIASVSEVLVGLKGVNRQISLTNTADITDGDIIAGLTSRGGAVEALAARTTEQPTVATVAK